MFSNSDLVKGNDKFLGLGGGLHVLLFGRVSMVRTGCTDVRGYIAGQSGEVVYRSGHGVVLRETVQRQGGRYGVPIFRCSMKQVKEW